MKISSPWNITWDPDGGSPLELVSIGQELDESIRLPCRQAIQEARGVGAENAEYLPRKQWSGSFSFTAYKDHATVAAAILSLTARHLEVRAIERADLQLLSSDGSGGFDEIRATKAVLEDIDPRPNFSAAAPAQTVISYTFKISDFVTP